MATLNAIFPEAVPVQNRFKLQQSDYTFLWLGIFPRECDWPKYDSSYYNGFVKYFLFDKGNGPHDSSVREFNKVGQAYGTLTDVAYIVDFEQNVEFMLAATILCNPDGIFNDNEYTYDQVGLPFLANLGRAVLEYERKRPRKVTPDLIRIRL